MLCSACLSLYLREKRRGVNLNGKMVARSVAQSNLVKPPKEFFKDEIFSAHYHAPKLSILFQSTKFFRNYFLKRKARELI
jgi:hypothetical protein